MREWIDEAKGLIKFNGVIERYGNGITINKLTVNSKNVAGLKVLENMKEKLYYPENMQASRLLIRELFEEANQVDIGSIVSQVRCAIKVNDGKVTYNNMTVPKGKKYFVGLCKSMGIKLPSGNALELNAIYEQYLKSLEGV